MEKIDFVLTWVDGSEDRLKSLIPDRLPEEIRKAYENAHR